MSVTPLTWSLIARAFPTIAMSGRCATVRRYVDRVTHIAGVPFALEAVGA
jgi:hypothetical protein